MKKQKKEFTPDFLNIPYVVMDMQPADRFVFGAIYMFSQLSQKLCTASNVALGKIAKVSPETVSNSLIKLEEKGFIKRVFKDDNKRTRECIQCLVGYVKIPPTNDIDTISRLDVIPSTDEQIKNIDKDISKDIAKANLEVFDSKKYFENTARGGNKNARVIAYFGIKKQKYAGLKSKTDCNAFLYNKRLLSVAARIAKFPDDEITKAFYKAENETINGKQVEWGLESVEKKLLK